jgi:transcriptional regulator with XRE-family HTH domain
MPSGRASLLLQWLPKKETTVEMLNGPLIRYLREQKGWDQQTLAAKANVHPSVISRLERGLQDDVRFSVVVAIAQTLGVSIDSLVREAMDGVAIAPPASMIAELEIMIREFGNEPIEIQRQAAGILRGFLSALRN